MIENEVKVVLLGETAVGKSSIIKQFVDHEFDSEVGPSISSKFVSKEIELKEINKEIKINLWDTAGQERYRSLAKIFYKDAQIIIFVYDITNKISFDSLSNFWYKEVINNSLSNVIFAVVGNKIDLYEYSKVSEDEAKNWADSINATFQLTSAKNNSGIDLLFENLIKKIYIPNFDYNKEDDKNREEYEQKKFDEEREKRNKQNDDDDENIIPRGGSIILNKKDISQHNKKKKKCC